MASSSSTNAGSSIAYLIPEFPGQTHAFFWRERARLHRLGDRVAIFTTGKPPEELRARHAWAEEAEALPPHLPPLDARALRDIASELRRAGREGLARVARAMAAGEAPTPMDRVKLGGALLLGARLAAEARREGITHVHVHSCANSANVAMLANRLSGLSYSLTLHNPLDCYGPNQPEKWRHAAFAIVITRAIRDEVEEELAGALPPRLFIAPMGVDEEAFCREAAYEPYAGEGPFRVFSCSRLNPVKAVDDLVRAIAGVAEAGVDVELRIAGADDVGGQYQAQVEALAKELGVADRVHLLGSVSEDVVLGELRRSHAFALASLAEPLGVAIAEAMAVEVPVVVTDAGGVPELVTHEESGLMVPPRAPERMAEGLLRVAREPELARKLSRGGRETVLRGFHSGVSAEAIHEGVKEALGGGAPRADLRRARAARE